MIRSMIAALALCLSPAVALASEAYAPMAPFAAVAGKSFRAEWTEPDGKKTVDVQSFEMILDGRALQSTHRLENSTYGGRSIYLYDEGAKTYVVHYFTTGGFHTLGSGDFKDGAFTLVETVSGHESVAAVRAKMTFAAEEMRVEVTYVGKDGTETAAPARVYGEVADPGPLFQGGD